MTATQTSHGAGGTEADTVSIPEISAADLHAQLRDGDELALLDVRQLTDYALGQILLAVSLPSSELELRIRSLVPRLGTRIVLYDDGGESRLAVIAARTLLALRYDDVAVLRGGLAQWRGAGYEVFGGVHVVSKALGEFVQEQYKTPSITVDDLKAKLDSGADVVVFDSRPLPEFREVSIPGGIDCPGAELVYRVADLVPSPDTLVVINCAGRTRAIIGAQALINAGVLPNQIVELENGTSAWQLAGFAPARGENNYASEPGAEGKARARETAHRLTAKFGIQHIELAQLNAFRDDRSRTLYVFDVRDPDDFAQGHLRGARSAPGGQLVQELDSYVGTNHARIVLADGSDGVRATITASWLLQLGLDDVFVLAVDPTDSEIEVGPSPSPVAGLPEVNTFIAAGELAALLGTTDVAVLDFANSTAFRKGHIPDAWYASRARLDEALAAVPAAGSLVLTSPDGVAAAFAANELRALTARDIRVLRGGTSAWTAAGFKTESLPGRFTVEPRDFWGVGWDDIEARRLFYNDYIRWADAIVAQIERDGSVHFRAYAADDDR